MGWSLINYTSAGTNSANAAVTTTAIDTTGADLIIATVSNADSAGVASVSDSPGNTWTALTRSNVVGVGAVQIFYCASPTTSATHTVTVGAVANSLASVTFLALAGASGSPYDTEANNTGSATTASLTPANSGEVLVSVYQDAGSTSISLSTPCTYWLASAYAVIGGTRFAHSTAVSFPLNTSASTVTFVPNNSISPSTASAAFIPAAGGGVSGGAWAFA